MLRHAGEKERIGESETPQPSDDEHSKNGVQVGLICDQQSFFFIDLFIALPYNIALRLTECYDSNMKQGYSP